MFGTPSTQSQPAQFNFGAGLQTTSSAFGSPFSTPSTGTAFGATSTPAPAFGAATTPAPAFGAATSSAAPAFGANISLGAPGFGTVTSAAPAFGIATSAAPGFGMASSAAPGFGISTSTAPTFGAATGAAPAFGAATGAIPAFGAAMSATPAFGATTSAAPPFGAATSAAPPFGAATSAAPPFGAATSAAPSFGAATSAAPAFGITTSATPAFGANTVSQGLSFGLGATNPTASSAPTLNFGTPAVSTAAATTAPSFGFGTSGGFAIATAASSLNIPATTTSSLFATPTAGGFGLSSATSAPTFSFNTSTPASSSALNPNPLGTVTTGSTGLSFGLSTSTSNPTTSQPVGLGGQAGPLDTKPKFDVTATSASGATSQKETNPREQPLPNEIMQCVENFKQYIKQQKIYSSEIARCSIKEFEKVKSDIDTFHKALVSLEREIQMNRCLAEKLKYDTAKGLQHIEMAQRTQETPPGLQYENVAPMQYFSELVDNFEKEMHTLKIQIESTDKYVRNFGKPASLTSQDLTLGMRRLHETFVALAGRLQSVHSQVESQKESYMNIRRHVLNDHTNPFENRNQNIIMMPKNTYITPKVGSGPTPFNNMVISSVTLTNYQTQPPTASLSGTMMGGFGAPTFPTMTTQSNPLFGNTNFSYPSSSFQLQKPPTGNKRGKQ